MKAEVERFYKEEFEPALMKKSSLSAPEGSLLPSVMPVCIFTTITWQKHQSHMG
jgi:hypothetical protein